MELKIVKFNGNFKKLIPELSIKYLIFIILIIIGCSYQVIKVTQVFLKFETKVDVKYEQNNEIVIPMVSFCKKQNLCLEIHHNKSTDCHLHKFIMTIGFTNVFFSLNFIVRTFIENWPIIDFDEIWCGHWGPLVKHNGWEKI